MSIDAWYAIVILCTLVALWLIPLGVIRLARRFERNTIGPWRKRRHTRERSAKGDQ